MNKRKPLTELRNLGAFLQAARENKGWSQTDLAARTGLNPSAISHFECGRREPSIGNLRKLCVALGASADAALNLELHRETT